MYHPKKNRAHTHKQRMSGATLYSAKVLYSPCSSCSFGTPHHGWGVLLDQAKKTMLNVGKNDSYKLEHEKVQCSFEQSLLYQLNLTNFHMRFKCEWSVWKGQGNLLEFEYFTNILECLHKCLYLEWAWFIVAQITMKVDDDSDSHKEWNQWLQPQSNTQFFQNRLHMVLHPCQIFWIDI